VPPIEVDEPVYVASGLYLDEPSDNGWPAGDETRPVATRPGNSEPTPRASGRTLPAFGSRVAVGLGLGAVILASLLVWRPAFLGVIVVAIGVAVWELVRAVRANGVNPPLIPLVAGGALMAGLAWWGGTDGLTFGLAITVLAVMAWRFAYGVDGYARDVLMATLIAVYVPFLGGFAAMLASPHDGHRRVLAVLIAVVLSDTGGYVVGAKFGRHAMAPSVSPKKSWEGLLGSLGAAALGSALVVSLMFHVAPWWGLLFGLAIAVASVIGDLGESMLKRDLGVKDMSGLLPGHGGIMDRLDSVLLAAPAGFLMLWAIAPVTG
jgi:phosphatidate cytidylyltransferase